MGFLSRFILFSYSYSPTSVDSILSRYSERGLGKETDKVRIKLPRHQVSVELPREMADRIDPVAKKVGQDYDLYGFRAKINFRCLLKCLAFRNRRRMVTEAEFGEFLELSEYMNFSYKTV